MNSSAPPPVSAADVAAAAARLQGHAVRTPLIENAQLNEIAGGRVLLKLETLQHTGSFKFRGAYNRLVQLDSAQRSAGVVAWSSGNHAQGVAYAGRLLGVAATIVMPADAPAIKIANTRRLGAEVVLYDRYTQIREQIGRQIAAERACVVVPAYDDPDIIAGQGTVGLEMAQQAEARGLAIDQALFCCSGGGLVGGSALALKIHRAATAVYTVEPAGFDDHARSLSSGCPERNPADSRSICDALQAPTPGEVTFLINRALLTGGLVVTDDEVREAMRFAFNVLKLVVEPGGAVALAAVLQRRLNTTGLVTALPLSGANVDPDQFAAIISMSRGTHG